MSTFTNIPPEIAAKLDQSLRRVRSILRLRGCCVVLFVGLVSVLLHMAVLAMLGDELPTVAGWTLWALSLGAVVATAWFALIKPLRRKFTAAEIASLIERNHPELEERLSTVVELAATGEVEASSSLLAEITRAAVADAGKVSPKREFTRRTVKPRLLAALAGLVVLGGLFALFPTETTLLLVKAVNPAAEIENIYAGAMDITPRGTQTVLKGTPFLVTLRESGGSGTKAYVLTRWVGAADEVSERMSLESREDRVTTFCYSYPGVESDFVYRVKCGRAVSAPVAVKVVEKPAFTERRIEIVHPAYTRRAPDVNLKDGTIVGLAGSTVKVSVKPSRGDLGGALELPGELVAVPARPDADGLFHFAFPLTPEAVGAWGIHLWDANGFSNDCERASIALVKDLPPEIKLTMPTEPKLKLPKTGELPLAWEIKEDFGLARTVLEMCVGAGAWTEVTELESVPAGGVMWTGDKVEPFVNKDFGNAGVIRFRIKVEDNLPAEQEGPNVALSPEITVELASNGTSLMRQSLKAETEKAKKDLDDIEKRLRDAKNNAHAAGNNYKSNRGAWAEGEARKYLGWAKSNMTNAERMLDEFITGLEESRLETGAEIFRPLLDDPFQPARQKIEDVYLIARLTDKGDACYASEPIIQQCIDRLGRARQRFNALTKKAMDLQKLEEYAEREKALAELAEEGEIDATTLAEQQEQLEKTFNEEFKDELNRNLNWQKDQAKKLEEKAEKLAARQEELKAKADELKEADENARKAFAQEEKKLADAIKHLANETASLKENVERTTGPFEDDPQKTAEPLENARKDENQAVADAREAADKATEGALDEAKEKMQAVQDALNEAKQQLGEMQERIGEKNQELAANTNDFKDMSAALHEAVESARAAAKEQTEQEAAEQQRQRDGEQTGEGQPAETQRQESTGQRSDERQASDQQGEGRQGDKQQQPQGGEQQQQGGEKKQASGEQQPQGGEQQQGQQQSAAQQQAQQAARDAAQKMQQKAQQQAQQGNLPFDQFQQDAQRNSQQMPPSNRPNSQSPSNQPNGQPLPDSQQPGEKPSPPPPSRRDPVGQQGEVSAAEAGEDWFKMKGDVKTEADVDKMDDVPEDYRGLVRDYFDALKKGGK